MVSCRPCRFSHCIESQDCSTFSHFPVRFPAEVMNVPKVSTSNLVIKTVFFISCCLAPSVTTNNQLYTDFLKPVSMVQFTRMIFLQRLLRLYIELCVCRILSYTIFSFYSESPKFRIRFPACWNLMHPASSSV